MRLLKTISVAGFCLLTLLSTVFSRQQEKPNILWITSEDNSASYLGCYGNKQATTPNLDALAEEGILYEHAYANAPVCAPARSTIITGMYASSLGTHHMRSTNDISAEVRLFPEYLRKEGYYCINNSKEDYNLDKDTWKKYVSAAWDESSNNAQYKNREPEQPFFAVFNTNLSHEHKIHDNSLIKRENLKHNPEKLELAPYHPDLTEIRHCYANYYDYISRMDAWVGKKLKELEESGLAENTIVFYYGDHGGVLPRSKRFIYESGTRVPLIIRFPEKYRHLAPGKPGSREDRIVSFVDLAPTVLSLAGIEIPSHLQGKAFLGEAKTADPEYVHLFRGRMDERYDMMRGVRDQKFHYIRNYMPHRIYGQHLNYLWKSPSIRAWEDHCRDGNCNKIQNRFWGFKPTEELYDNEKDPHNVHNLAGNPEYREVLLRMREENARWVRKNHDPGFIPEGMMMEMTGNKTPFVLVHEEDYPAEAIISSAEMASEKNPEDLELLIKGLSHQHPVIRYWSATGCAIQAEKAKRAIPALKTLLEDPYGNNRITAAEALCKMGDKEQAIQILLEELNNENEMIQLHALNVLEVLEDIIEIDVVKAEIKEKSDLDNRSRYFKQAFDELSSDD